MRFAEQLERAVESNRSRLCIGLDPVLERIPGGDVLAWARSIISATADIACCYKPNSAFFEALGPHGWELLAETVGAVPPEMPVVLDAKRGDIGSTAEAYARAAFEVIGAGAVTVNPYLGGDTMEPFLKYADRSIFVVCRTSNPGATEFQDLPVSTPGGSRPLYELIAERSRAWNRDGNVGLVTGATFPKEIARIRALCPDQTLLVPGVGAQGGDLRAAVQAAVTREGGGFMVNASRQVIYAAEDRNFAQATRAVAADLRQQIEAARQVSPTGV
jgi:orotidine-5'-phosphate decarboxylase